MLWSTLLVALVVAGLGQESSDGDLLTLELAAWQAFFDAAGGSEWEACRDMRERPCACTSMENEVRCVEGTIRSIKLQSNNVRMSTERATRNATDALASMGQLTSIDLTNPSTNNLNVLSWANQTCFPLPTCGNSLQCSLPDGIVYCHMTPAPTLAPSQSPTPEPTLRPRSVHRADLMAWRTMYDSLNGPEWTYCADKRDDPCSCNSNGRRVLCQEEFITEISLRRNNVKGNVLPEYKISSMERLELLELDNGLYGPDGNSFAFYDNQDEEGKLPCVDIPSCETTVCTLPAGLKFCYQDTSSEPTAPPTEAAELQETDAAFWKALYENTGGEDWAVTGICSATEPCECGDGEKKFVRCEDGRITQIVLPDVGMAGSFPAELLSGATELFRIELGNSGVSDRENAFDNTGCVRLPQCEDQVACDFSGSDLTLCALPTAGPTLSPSAEPTKLPVSPLDYLCRVRFANADFNSESSSHGLHMAYLRRAFPGALEIQVMATWQGSVGVDFALNGYIGEPLHSKADIVTKITSAMTASEKAVVEASVIEVELFFQVPAGPDVVELPPRIPRTPATSEDKQANVPGVAGTAIAGVLLVSAALFVWLRHRVGDSLSPGAVEPRPESHPSTPESKELACCDTTQQNDESLSSSEEEEDIEMQLRRPLSRPKMPMSASKSDVKTSSFKRKAGLFDRSPPNGRALQANLEVLATPPSEFQRTNSVTSSQLKSSLSGRASSASSLAKSLSKKVLRMLPSPGSQDFSSIRPDDDDESESDAEDDKYRSMNESVHTIREEDNSFFIDHLERVKRDFDIAEEESHEGNILPEGDE